MEKTGEVMNQKEREKTRLNRTDASVLTCQSCKNTYVVLWLDAGKHFKDFGYRHCPFCGLAFDELTGSVID